ncbi:MAG: hypothetical protein KAI47_17245 [Deltaproteobacteria bacterium]|nr:hypothetical protein [Deltaproteobacteria bacterium]
MGQDPPSQDDAAPRSFLAEDNKTYIDDVEGIGDADLLLRRVPWWHIIWDQNTERWRPSSAAFENNPKDGSPMSVRMGPLLESMGFSLASVLDDYPDFGLVEFPAGEARTKNQVVAFDALENEPAHAVVAGRKTGGVKKHLMKSSRWSMPLSEAALAKARDKRTAI